MTRFLAPLCVLALAGCEQARPPSAAVVAARSAVGTRNTNFETKIQPKIPRAGETSVWDFKVYDKKNKPDGTRKEWKFFNALPQSSDDKSITEVLMNTWLISKDRKVFLQQKPTYKAYGSFLGDWTIPQSGAYTLYVEYQPVVAKDELSAADFKKGSEILPVEQGRWDVNVVGTGTAARPLMPSEDGGAFGIYSLNPGNYGASVAGDMGMETKLKLNQSVTLRPSISPTSSSVTDMAVTALSPDGKILLHAVGHLPKLTFTQEGKWRAWFSFLMDGKPVVAPVDFDVS